MMETRLPSQVAIAIPLIVAAALNQYMGTFGFSHQCGLAFHAGFLAVAASRTQERLHLGL